MNRYRRPRTDRSLRRSLCGYVARGQAEVLVAEALSRDSGHISKFDLSLLDFAGFFEMAPRESQLGNRLTSVRLPPLGKHSPVTTLSGRFCEVLKAKQD